MAKRFTDSEKWKDDWFGELSNDYRIIWLWLVDSCSIAGIWKKDFRGLNFNCNTSISEDEFRKTFEKRVIEFEKFYFIPKFLKFQYPTGLNSEKPAIISIRNQIIENNLQKHVISAFGNDYLIIKESLSNDSVTIKDKDKDMDKDREKRGAGEKGENHNGNGSVTVAESLEQLKQSLKEK